MTKRFKRGTTVWLTALCASCLFSAHASGSTLTVTTTADGGPGSLRQAMADAAPGDMIVLDVKGTITLTSGPLVVTTDNVTIAGPDARALAIDAGHSSRVFEIGTAWSRVHVGISGLTLRNGSAATGGGILNEGSLGLMDVILTGHVASDRGGAVANRGTLVLLDTLVTANRAGIGGGIENDGGVVSIYRSTVSNNTADGPYGGMGGGIASATGGFGGGPAEALTIRDSLVSNNIASLRGGAIYNASGMLTIVNSTIASNSCTYAGLAGPCLCPGGGGIYNSMGAARIERSTIAGNSASTAGGAITTLYGSITLNASILAKGSAGPNCYAGRYGTIASDGFNLSDDPSCASAFTAYGDRNDTPAGLSPMGVENNGGPTGTIQLLPSSPAIDAVPVCGGADQRGVSRLQGSACDIGAYERVASPYSADVQMPIRSDGTTVFTGKRGVVPVKFTLSGEDMVACALPPAMISVARIGGDSTGPVSEATYEMPADTGRNFRVDIASCGYEYNLATATFTPGSYWVSISIDGVVAGYAEFGVR